MPFSVCRISLLLLFALASGSAFAGEPARVFAAASLTRALDESADTWQRLGHPRPVLVYGGSSALAKQIEAGAPADLFASADVAWMDYLDRRGLIEAGSRRDLLGNSLVMIVPKGHRFAMRFESSFDLAHAFNGMLCTGEAGLPLGEYARQALRKFGWIRGLKNRLVGADDARAALAFVERGECAAGIVYATDALASSKVEVVGRFPDASHTRIVYPLALLKTTRPEALPFLAFITHSPQAAAIFVRHGFLPLRPTSANSARGNKR